MTKYPSERCFALVREFEGLKLEVYKCPSGVWTIGYGHTKYAHVFNATGLKITRLQAEGLLKYDLRSAAYDVEQLVKVPLTRLQFDALCSFVFNVGSDIDEDSVAEGLGDSTLLKKLNARDYRGAAQELLKWNKGRSNGQLVEMAGLTRRREAERQLFLEGTT